MRHLFNPDTPSGPWLNSLGWILDSLVLGLIAVLFWMALGDPPVWVAGPVMIFWWGWVGLKFIFLGLPFFVAPLWLLWEAVRPGGETADEEAEREHAAKEEEADEAAAEWLGGQPDIKSFGFIPGRIFVNLRKVLLLIGLLAAGEYLLAALYIFPELAEFTLNQINRLRAARGGHQA